jgi:uncharacterized protein with beta-barrel porin domain
MRRDMPVHRRRPAIAVALGFVLVLGLLHAADAQNLPPYSVAVGLPTPTGLVTLPGLDTAQQTMAQSIDRVCPTINTIAATPGQRDLANICSAMTGNAVILQGQPNPLGLPTLGLDANGLKDALTQLNGGTELVVPTSQATSLGNQQSNAQSGVIEARLSRLRDRMTGTALAVNGQPGSYQLAATDAGSGLGGALPPDVGMWNGRLGLFLDGIGQFGSSDTTSRQNGYSFDNGGFVTGLDYQFTSQFAAGLAFGYTRASTDFDVTPTSPSGQYLHSDLLQGNFYATYVIDPSFYLAGAASIGGGTSDSRRHLVIPSATPMPTIGCGNGFQGIDCFYNGSFGNRSDIASFGGGYVVPLAPWTLTATARFQYSYNHADGFTESGAGGGDLTFGSTSRSAYQSFVGGQVAYALPTAWGILSPLARFEWAHQFNSGNTSVSVAYAEDPSLLSAFTLAGDSSSSDYVDLGAGVSLQFSPATSGFITYDAIVGLSHTSYNSVIGGIRMRF